ncbi:Berberine and berberine like [Aspergillus parasiticus SU-1]|uniref:Berberine and berberine like n=1 Tax=Aspergillus parasiticus (strain ATCC 56775 / NRRL 5862 / SRRC 143 / SU-1) TaxID=1403190 RepID=A0A0F0I383_ASPPU|nr:Berberine and berberine like [Aspergillus parasiticus SU-1]
MAALPSVAVIVTGANLDPKNIPQVETLVEEFTNLSPTERDNERGSFVEKAFPLFFDENAVVHGSSAYEAQRQVPCHDFRTMSSQPSLEVYETVERVRVEQEGLLSDVEELRISNVIQPMSSISIKQSREVSGNPLGLEEVGQQWFLAMADWNNPADGGHVRQAMRHIVDAVEATAKANGTYLPYHYCNYASPDQDPLASYGTENLEKLREIASKYDPDGVFQTL